MAEWVWQGWFTCKSIQNLYSVTRNGHSVTRNGHSATRNGRSVTRNRDLFLPPMVVLIGDDTHKLVHHKTHFACHLDVFAVGVGPR